MADLVAIDAEVSARNETRRTSPIWAPFMADLAAIDAGMPATNETRRPSLISAPFMADVVAIDAGMSAMNDIWWGGPWPSNAATRHPRPRSVLIPASLRCAGLAGRTG